MIRNAARIISLFLFLLTFSSIALAQQVNVMTFNIRYDNPGDGENQWCYRKENVASMVQFYEADICGMQEALHRQLVDLDKLLPGYSRVGAGRDDGKESGEYSPIFYRNEKFTLLESHTFWLSLTPDVPGKSWDAAFNRIVTWAKFKYKKGDKTFYVFNTHFDHIGQVARKESALLLLRKVKEIAGNTPAMVTGDFNSTPEQEPIKILNKTLIDTKKISKSGHFGPESTFNGFESKEIEGRLIDYIFVNSANIKVLKHATLDNSWKGRFASDHHAVWARMVL